MTADAEDAFQKELVELFVQEAQEWLQQIHVSLDELQQNPPPDRYTKLAQTMKVGIANLGGSAATIGLHDLERASFAALPFVEAVQTPSAQVSVNDFIILCKQLGHIHTALTRATGVTFDPESVADGGAPGPVTMAAADLLGALRHLELRMQEEKTSRNLVQAVISQVEGLMANGVMQCDATSMREFLDRLSGAEETFQTLVTQHLPHIAAGIERLKADPQGAGSPAMLEQVAALWTAAQQVNSPQAMTFFMGLHSFLNVVLQHRRTIAAVKYDAIQARLKMMGAGIAAWVESGRAERAAIDRVLPA